MLVGWNVGVLCCVLFQASHSGNRVGIESHVIAGLTLPSGG